MTPQPQHPQRCDKSCEHFNDSGRTNKIFGLAFCKKHSLVVEPIFQNQTKITGCASHSSAGAQQQRIDVIEILKEVEQFIKKEAMLTTLEWHDVEMYFQKKIALLQAGDQG